MMNPIQRVEHFLKKQFPSAMIALDAPQKANGPWFLDINLDGHSVVVIEWQPKRGFGLKSSLTPAYGDWPDEVFSDHEAVQERVYKILGGKT